MQGIQVLPLKKITPPSIIVKGDSVIGCVGSAEISTLSKEYQEKLKQQKGLLLFNSAREALLIFKKTKGTIREDLDDIVMQNIEAPIVLSIVSVTATQLQKKPQEFYGVATLKTKVLEAIDNLAYCRTLFGRAYKVRWTIAGYFSHDLDVQERMNVFVEKTKTVGIYELNQDSVQGAVKLLEKIGKKRILVNPFYGKKWSNFENKEIFRPLSAILAGHSAHWDSALGEFGFAYSHGNRLIKGVTGLPVLLSYEEGAICDVNTLADNGAVVIFNDNGFELYNFETTYQDETENKLEFVRFHDRLAEEIQKGLKKYHQRPFTEVKEMADLTIEQFLGKVKKSGAALGYEVWLSEENSGAEVSAGRLYISYKVGNNPAIRTIIVQPWATSEYTDRALEE